MRRSLWLIPSLFLSYIVAGSKCQDSFLLGGFFAVLDFSGGAGGVAVGVVSPGVRSTLSEVGLAAIHADAVVLHLRVVDGIGGLPRSALGR